MLFAPQMCVSKCQIFESDSDPQEPSEGEAGSSEREVESPAAVPSATSKAAEPAVQIQKNLGER